MPNAFTNEIIKIIEDAIDRIPTAIFKNQIPSAAIPPASSTARGGVLLSDTNPAADGVAAPGTSSAASRGDHVHPSGGGGSSITIQEVDGTPSESAPTKLIFPNGTLSVSTHEVTYTPTGGGGTDAVTTGTVAAVIGGLAGSPDVNGVGGAGTAREFEAGDTAPTWSSAPLSTDVGVTAASHLYIQNNSGTERRGLYAWAPGSGAFDARTRVAGIATDANGNGGAFGLLITSASDAERLLLEFEFVNGGQWIVNGYSYASGSYTARFAGNFALTGANDSYLRITRDGSNNCTFWISSNGLAWQQLATFSFTLTVANIGFRSTGDASGVTYTYVDWLRTSV